MSALRTINALLHRHVGCSQLDWKRRGQVLFGITFPQWQHSAQHRAGFQPMLVNSVNGIPDAYIPPLFPSIFLQMGLLIPWIGEKDSSSKAFLVVAPKMWTGAAADEPRQQGWGLQGPQWGTEGLYLLPASHLKIILYPWISTRSFGGNKIQ